MSVFNRTTSKTEKFIEDNPGKKLFGAKTVEELCQSLSTPRKVMLMVQAGGPVDDTIEQIRPYLDKGDIIIDGGNE